jgi:hypothetical protein
MDYKKMDIWQLLVAMANDEETDHIRKKISSKYTGTAVEGNPIAYEMNKLADSIVASEGYTTARKWMRKHSTKMIDVFYIMSLDSRLFERDK